MAAPYEPVFANNPYITDETRARAARRSAVPDGLVDVSDPYAGNWGAETTRSVAMNLANTVPAVEALGRAAFGDEEGAAAAGQRYLAGEQAAREAGPAIQSFDDAAAAGGGVGDYGAALGYQAAGFVPDVALSLTGAGLGAGVARRGARRAVTGALADQIEGRARNVAAREVAVQQATARAAVAAPDGAAAVANAMKVARAQVDDAARKAAMTQAARIAGRTPLVDAATKAGRFAGAAAGQVPSATRETIGELEDNGYTQRNAGLAAAGVAASSAIGALPFERFLGRFGGEVAEEAARATPRFTSRLAKEFGKQGLAEGTAEVAQSASQLASFAAIENNLDRLTDADARKNYLQSFAAGFLVGGGLGAAGEAGSTGTRWVGQKAEQLRGQLRENLTKADGLRKKARGGEPVTPDGSPISTFESTRDGMDVNSRVDSIMEDLNDPTESESRYGARHPANQLTTPFQRLVGKVVAQEDPIWQNRGAAQTLGSGLEKLFSGEDLSAAEEGLVSDAVARGSLSQTDLDKWMALGPETRKQAVQAAQVLADPDSDEADAARLGAEDVAEASAGNEDSNNALNVQQALPANDSRERLAAAHVAVRTARERGDREAEVAAITEGNAAKEELKAELTPNLKREQRSESGKAFWNKLKGERAFVEVVNTELFGNRPSQFGRGFDLRELASRELGRNSERYQNIPEGPQRAKAALMQSLSDVFDAGYEIKWDSLKPGDLGTSSGGIYFGKLTPADVAAAKAAARENLARAKARQSAFQPPAGPVARDNSAGRARGEQLINAEENATQNGSETEFRTDLDQRVARQAPPGTRTGPGQFTPTEALVTDIRESTDPVTGEKTYSPVERREDAELPERDPALRDERAGNPARDAAREKMAQVLRDQGLKGKDLRNALNDKMGDFDARRERVVGGTTAPATREASVPTNKGTGNGAPTPKTKTLSETLGESNSRVWLAKIADKNPGTKVGADATARFKALSERIKKAASGEVERLKSSTDLAGWRKAVADIGRATTGADALTAALPHLPDGMKQLAQKLLDTGALANTKVEHNPLGSGSTYGMSGSYNGVDDAIKLTPRLGKEGSKLRQPGMTVLHEAVHAATTHAEANDAGFRNELESLFAQAQAGLKAAGAPEFYGMGDTQEFLAEAFSNPTFQAVLAEIPSKKGGSIWTQFMNSVLKALGFPPSPRGRSLLQDVLEHGIAGAEITGKAKADAAAGGPEAEWTADLLREWKAQPNDPTVGGSMSFGEGYALRRSTEAFNAARAAGASIDDAQKAGDAVENAVFKLASQIEKNHGRAPRGDRELGNSQSVPPAPNPALANVAVPQDFDAFAKFIREDLPVQSRQILNRVLNRPDVVAKLRKYYSDNPEALRAIDDASAGLENRIAYAYAAWASDAFDTDAAGTKAFNSLGDKLLGAMNAAGDGTYAHRIFNDIANGTIEQLRQRNLTYDVKALEARGRGKLDRALNAVGDKLAGANEAFSSVVDSKVARMQDSGVPALRELAAFIQRPQGTTGSDRGYIPAVRDTTYKLMRKASNTLRGLNDADQAAAINALQEQIDPNTGAWRQLSPDARDAVLRMRNFMDGAYQYAKAAGVDFGKRENYFPVIFNTADRDLLPKLKAIYNQPKFEPALRKLLNDSKTPFPQLLDTFVNNTVREYSPSRDVSEPTMRAENYRASQFIYDLGNSADIKKFVDLQEKSPSVLLARYVEPLVKRAEYSRRAKKYGGDLEPLFARMKAEGATAAQIEEGRDQLKAALGTYSQDASETLKKLSPSLAKKLSGGKTRSVVQGAQAYQNLRLLPLSLISSLVDPMGVAVRTGGDFGTAWKGFKKGMQSVYSKASREEQLEALSMLGAAEDMVPAMAATQGFDAPPNNAASWVNERVFKYNGMNAWVRATRFMALEAANRFLIKHAAGGTEHSQRYLDELGVEPGDVQVSGDGKVKVMTPQERKAATPEQRAADTRVRNALMQFVDEAILRPNSQQTPLWHSDPYMGLVSQYKGFAYAMYDQILGRISRESQHGNAKVLLPALGYVPVVVAAELLRELIQYGGEGNPNRKDWGPQDYALLGAERSGLISPRAALLEDTVGDVRRNNLPGSSQLGPSLGQAGNALDALEGRRNRGTEVEAALPAAAAWRHWNDGTSTPPTPDTEKQPGAAA